VSPSPTHATAAYIYRFAQPPTCQNAANFPFRPATRPRESDSLKCRHSSAKVQTAALTNTATHVESARDYSVRRLHYRRDVRQTLSDVQKSIVWLSLTLSARAPCVQFAPSALQPHTHAPNSRWFRAIGRPPVWLVCVGFTCL